MIPDLPVYIAKALKANPKAWAFFRAGMALSARELEVLELLGKGKSNREIAAELAITEATVKAHVTNILSRLGVSDRTQAVITALKHGLVHL